MFKDWILLLQQFPSIFFPRWTKSTPWCEDTVREPTFHCPAPPTVLL